MNSFQYIVEMNRLNSVKIGKIMKKIKVIPIVSTSAAIGNLGKYNVANDEIDKNRHINFKYLTLKLFIEPVNRPSDL